MSDEQRQKVSIFDLPTRKVFFLTNEERKIFKAPPLITDDDRHARREVEAKKALIRRAAKKKKSVIDRQAMIVKFVARISGANITSEDICDFIEARIANVKRLQIAGDLSYLIKRGHLKKEPGRYRKTSGLYRFGDVPFNEGKSSE